MKHLRFSVAVWITVINIIHHKGNNINICYNLSSIDSVILSAEYNHRWLRLQAKPPEKYKGNYNNNNYNLSRFTFFEHLKVRWNQVLCVTVQQESNHEQV